MHAMFRIWNVTDSQIEMVNDNLAQLVVEFGNGNLSMASTDVYQIMKWDEEDQEYKVIMTIIGH